MWMDIGVKRTPKSTVFSFQHSPGGIIRATRTILAFNPPIIKLGTHTLTGLPLQGQEIFAQVRLPVKELGALPAEFHFSAVGEPLLNAPAVCEAIRTIYHLSPHVRQVITTSVPDGDGIDHLIDVAREIPTVFVKISKPVVDEETVRDLCDLLLETSGRSVEVLR